MHRHFYNFVGALLAAALLAACGAGDKGPAETALKAVEAAINTAKGEADKYLPDSGDQLWQLTEPESPTLPSMSTKDHE